MRLLMKSIGCVSQRAPTAAVAPQGARAFTLTVLASLTARDWGRHGARIRAWPTSTARAVGGKELGDSQDAERSPDETYRELWCLAHRCSYCPTLAPTYFLQI